VVMCGFKNGQQEQTCLKEIRLCVQNLLTILSLVVNMIGEHQLSHFNMKHHSINKRAHKIQEIVNLKSHITFVD